MRIAISGAHCVGKSTLIEAFLAAHPEFIHEPEPYTVLVDEYGEEFSSSPTIDDFHRQLEFNIERLRTHGSNEKVIYERCPIDYYAYILALEDLGRERPGQTFLESISKSVLEALVYLDLIVYVPVEEGTEVSDEEDVELRDAVEVRLSDLFSGDDFNVVKMTTARGTIRQCLLTIEASIETEIRDTPRGLRQD